MATLMFTDDKANKMLSVVTPIFSQPSSFREFYNDNAKPSLLYHSLRSHSVLDEDEDFRRTIGLHSFAPTLE